MGKKVTQVYTKSLHKFFVPSQTEVQEGALYSTW